MFLKAGGTLAYGPEFSNHQVAYSHQSELLRGLNELTYLRTHQPHIWSITRTCWSSLVVIVLANTGNNKCSAVHMGSNVLQHTAL